MTAEEQLAIWAAAPNDDVFVWLEYVHDDKVFVSLGSVERPYVVGRMRAADALAGIQRTGSVTNGIVRDVSARFQKRVDAANSMRVEEIKGVTCVVVDGRSPVAPHAPYRCLLSSVEAFI